jgi:hypothetical protein
VLSAEEVVRLRGRIRAAAEQAREEAAAASLKR